MLQIELTITGPSAIESTTPITITRAGVTDTHNYHPPLIIATHNVTDNYT